MWPKFGSCKITIKEIMMVFILWRFDQKNWFFDSGWFKFNYLGVVLSITLKIYVIVTKELKLKVK